MQKYNIIILGPHRVGKTILHSKLSHPQLIFYDNNFPETVHGVIILFSLAELHTYNYITSNRDWAQQQYGEEIPILICANKWDRNSRSSNYLPVSARSGHNLDLIGKSLVSMMK